MAKTSSTHAGPDAAAPERQEIVRIQDKLARRFLLIFLVPLLAVLALGWWAYTLQSRLSQVEVGAQVNAIERVRARSQNLDLAIKEYEALVHSHPTPQLLARLGGLYVDRVRTGSRSKDEDTKRAIDLLQQAVEMDDNAADSAGSDSWRANNVLTSLYLELGEAFWPKAVAAGEQAVEQNPLDAETLNNLAWIYGTAKDFSLRDSEKARRYAKEAVRLTNWQDLNMVDTLVAVLKDRGERQDAIQVLELVKEKRKQRQPLTLDDLEEQLVALKNGERA